MNGKNENRTTYSSGNDRGSASFSFKLAGVVDMEDDPILRYCDLVKYIALRLVSRLPNHVQADDLFNAGIIGLIDAIDKFDVSQGTQFEAYAKIRVRGAMLDEIRSMDWIPRSLRQKNNELEKTCVALEQRLGRYPTDEEIAAELNLSIGDYYRLLDEVKGISLLPEDVHDAVNENKGGHSLATDSDDLFHRAYQKEIKAHLAEAISGLSKKEQQVMVLYYYEEITMNEIGAVLGYAEPRISQIHTKAILRLRTRLARKLKKDDLPDWCGQVVPENGTRQTDTPSATRKRLNFISLPT